MTAEETTVRMQIVYSQPTTVPTTTLMTSDTGTGTGSGTDTVSMKSGTAIAAIELTENFYINNRRKNNVKIEVKLSGSGIYLRRKIEHQDNVSEQLLRIEDIIGSRFGSRLKKRVRGGLSSCKRNARIHDNEEENSSATGQQKDISAYLYIYAYVKPEKIGAPRHRTVRILRFRIYERLEENLKSAERWHHAIRVNKHLTCGVMAAAEHPKPLLILLNPKSGSGKSRELFQRQVVPVLKEAEIHYELLITTHANYARDLVSSRKDLEKCYSGIVVASGDGLFYEVLNGLMERTDWRTVSYNLPIGIIPCGSGNGLAKSISHLYNEPYEPKPIMHATLTCVSGHTAPMDIVRVELAKSGAKPEEMYSFLSVGWGLIADIDIESERLRSIGAPRFTLWSIHRIISLRTYKGKLSYLPWKSENLTSENPQLKVQLEKTSGISVQKDESKPSQAVDVVENGFHDPEFFEEKIDDDDFFDDVDSLDGNNFRRHINSWHSTSSKRTAYYSIAGHSVRSRRSLTANKLESAKAEFETRTPGPPTSTIPPLNMPLPDDTWTSEEGEFIMVHAGYTTHLAADCFFAPESRLNDGIIYLVIIRAGCSRSQLLQFLLGLSNGTHIPCPPNEHIQVIPVRAFRIEPDGDDGIMAVDGERVDYGSIQAEIFPGIINVMVPSGK